MKIIHETILNQRGEFPFSEACRRTMDEIRQAIREVVWPEDSDRFTLHPSTDKGRGGGNGVVPIKRSFAQKLGVRPGWELEGRVDIGGDKRPGPVDVVKVMPDGRPFCVEWETGNISSSHRSLNKLALGILNERVAGGVVVLPTREMYRYLTDRIGNYEELQCYFPMWSAIPIRDGLLAVIAIEHDAVSSAVARIAKGTDGRALV